MLKGEDPTYMILLKKSPLTLACIQTFIDNFFQTWYDDRDY